MDTDKQSPIKCPKCSAENTRNRLTCELCGERLGDTISKMSKHPRKKKYAEPKIDPPNPDSQKQETEEESIPPKPTKVRSHRHRKSRKRIKQSPQSPFFFVLEGSKLKAVKINWGVTVPLRRKDLPKDARNLLSLWNRNKDIIKNA